MRWVFIVSFVNDKLECMIFGVLNHFWYVDYNLTDGWMNHSITLKPHNSKEFHLNNKFMEIFFFKKFICLICCCHGKNILNLDLGWHNTVCNIFYFDKHFKTIYMSMKRIYCFIQIMIIRLIQSMNFSFGWIVFFSLWWDILIWILMTI